MRVLSVEADLCKHPPHHPVHIAAVIGYNERVLLAWQGNRHSQ